MQKITNKQLKELEKYLTENIAKKVARNLQVMCPKTLSGKHVWVNRPGPFHTICKYCPTRKNI